MSKNLDGGIIQSSSVIGLVGHYIYFRRKTSSFEKILKYSLGEPKTAFVWSF
jgi:hypothetical protein